MAAWDRYIELKGKTKLELALVPSDVAGEPDVFQLTYFVVDQKSGEPAPPETHRFSIEELDRATDKLQLEMGDLEALKIDAKALQ